MDRSELRSVPSEYIAGTHDSSTIKRLLLRCAGQYSSDGPYEGPSWMRKARMSRKMRTTIVPSVAPLPPRSERFRKRKHRLF